MTDFAAARANMVESQIRPNKVTDPALIGAMGALPREQFVPAGRRPLAYVDEDLALGAGRHLMEPMVLARLIQTAAPEAGEIALVVGCGTGYAVAVLSRLCETVIGVESDAALAGRAAETLIDLGIDNALVVEGPSSEGYPKQAPYDVILFDGAIPDFPDAVAAQCAESGRMVGVLTGGGPSVGPGVGPGIGRATVGTKFGGIVSKRPVFDATVPPLPEFVEAGVFRF
ncbi:MAG: protein-L-isoaspartate O-methyltransferase [Rhodospirillaceae bacterium]|nr:protein-L-isoaspartate O-methyltransferase [Rhodospirillaceae bacterium]MYF87209.1 protein-L-isoaspartate O-methyltransferase [Rhodospirillaceae bacterium]MYH37361.1 protein-L-isoaspartate O-methyltransferase [Rhodospirillaceae bacterium]MYK13116.1 protein-L-isoaspartate O-methyltransferase [Rhodospirillaceae bacterium]